MRFVPQLCAEFPNDNPDLHDGALWVCGWTRARARAVVSAQGVARQEAGRSHSALPSEREFPADSGFEEVIELPQAAEPPVVELQEAVIEVLAVGAPEVVDQQDALELPQAIEPAALETPEAVVELPAVDLPEAAGERSVVDASANAIEASPEAEAATYAELDSGVRATLLELPELCSVLAVGVSPEEEPVVSEGSEAMRVADDPGTSIVSDVPNLPRPPQIRVVTPESGLSLQDDRAIRDAFDRFLGEDAHTPSENLSVLLARTVEPMLERATAMPFEIHSSGSGKPAAEQLSLLDRPPQLSLGWRRRAEPTVRTEAPVSAEPPVTVEMTASTTPEPADLRAELPRPHALVGDDDGDAERIVGAVSALDDLFDDADIAWQTPAPPTVASRASESTSTVEAPSSALPTPSPSFRVPRPTSFDGPEDALSAEPPLELNLEPLTLDLTPPPPGAAGWGQLGDFLAGFLLTRGATRAAALLGGLLDGRRVDLQRLPEASRSALCELDVAKAGPDGVFPSAEFRKEVTQRRLEFMSGHADSNAFLHWSSTFVRALLGNGISRAAVRAHLEQAGIEKLLRRAA